MSKFGDAVKKINARLEVFERRGLTGTWEYEQLRAQLATAAGDNMTLDSRGYTHISGRGLSSAQKDQIMLMSRSKTRNGKPAVTTASHAEKRLLKEYQEAFGDSTLSRREKIEQAAQFENDVHEFIKKHAADIYKIALFSAMIHRHSNLTPTEARALLDMYNSAEWKYHEELTSLDSYHPDPDTLAPETAYLLDMLDDLRSAVADLLEEMEGLSGADLEDAEIHIRDLNAQIGSVVDRLKTQDDMGGVFNR